MKKVASKMTAIVLAMVMVFGMVPQWNGVVSGDESFAEYSVSEDENSAKAGVSEDESLAVTEDSFAGYSVSYDFANSDAGSAYGKISVTTEEAGSYDLYWGDGSGNKLEYNGVEYSELGTCTTTENDLTAEYQVISEYTAIPDGAKELMVCDEDLKVVASYDIPESKQFSEGKLQYQFGLMSDVHFNRYSDYSDDDAVPAFNTALKFMNDQGIDFVGMTGDLSTSSETSAFTKFKSAIDQYSNMTVYTCMGNHDDYNITDFKKYVNVKKDTDSNVTDIDDTGVDLVYRKGGDVFIFFSQTKWSYNGKYSTLVTTDQLNWLEKTLNTYANKKVYLFFHTYFASEDGDVTTAVGNLMNPGGYTYDLTYTYGNEDEARFRKLLNKYPNVTMFSGHSHWAYDQQKYNANLNIGNIKNDDSGATLVHVSSVTAPRTIEENATSRDENNGVKSEGMVAFRYSNSTVYTGVDFKSGKYLAYASYLSDDGATGTPEAAVTVKKTKITKIGKVKKVSKKSKKYKVTIKYKKISNASRYQIKYSTSKKFKKKKTKTKTTTKTKYTLKKLKKNKTYYVKVRAFTYQFGYRVYGKWSKTRKIKTKKK